MPPNNKQEMEHSLSQWGAVHEDMTWMMSMAVAVGAGYSEVLGRSSTCDNEAWVQGASDFNPDASGTKDIPALAVAGEDIAYRTIGQDFGGCDRKGTRYGRPRFRR